MNILFDMILEFHFTTFYARKRTIFGVFVKHVETLQPNPSAQDISSLFSCMNFVGLEIKNIQFVDNKKLVEHKMNLNTGIFYE